MSCEFCGVKKLPIEMLEYAWGNHHCVLDLNIEGSEMTAYCNAYSTDSSFDDRVKINYCPMCGRKLQTGFDELTEAALRIRDIIHDSYPEKYDYYIGEMMRSPADIFSIAELIAEEVTADE